MEPACIIAGWLFCGNEKLPDVPGVPKSFSFAQKKELTYRRYNCHKHYNLYGLVTDSTIATTLTSLTMLTNPPHAPSSPSLQFAHNF